MPDRGSPERVGENRVSRAIGTSIRGNSTAFGFSIMITVSFGMLSNVEGAPKVFELFLFGVGAAAGLAILEGALTKGFRAEIERTSQEVRLLGTAMNFMSVAAGVAAALAVGELFDGRVAWSLAAFAAANVYVAAESAELLLAEEIQGARGAPVKASEEEGEG